MKQKYQSIVLVAVATILLVTGLVIGSTGFNSTVVAAAPQRADSTALPRTITVVGEGKVHTSPDMAQVTVGVDVTKPTVKEATTQSNKMMEKLKGALKAQGIADKDMQTSGYNVYIEQSPYPSPESSATSGEVKYRCGNNLTVAVHDLKKIDAVLEATVNGGANNISGVMFDLSDPSKAKSDARQKAVADAKAKAEELAKLNGVKVGSVVSISEVIGGYAGAYYDNTNRTFAGVGGSGTVSPGQLELVVQLQITYVLE